MAHRVRGAFALIFLFAPLAHASDQRYVGTIEKFYVRVDHARFCEEYKNTGSTAEPPQTGTTPNIPAIDYSKLACPWGSLSGITYKFDIPTTIPATTVTGGRGVPYFPVLDSPITSTVSAAGTGALTSKIREKAQLTATAMVFCREDACGQGNDAKDFTPPGSASAQKTYTTSFKTIEKTSPDPAHPEFSATFGQSVTVRLVTWTRDDPLEIRLSISVNVTYRFKAMPALYISGFDLLRKTFDKPGGRQTDGFSLMNMGGGTLNWTAEAITGSGGNWLFVDPAGGSLAPYPPAEARVTYGVDPAGVPGGTYTGKIRVSALGAMNSPIEIPINFTAEGTGDQTTLTNVIPDPGKPLAAGSGQMFVGTVQWKVKSKPDANALLRVYDQSGALLASGTPRTVTGEGSSDMGVSVQLPVTVTKVTLKAVLLDTGSGSLLAESGAITYGAGIADQVTIKTAGMTPDPSQPVPWADRLRVVATVEVALGTRDRADVVIRGRDQNDSALASCESNLGSGGRGQWEVPLTIVDCYITKSTKQVVLKAHLLEPGSTTILKSSAPVTLNLDVPQNSVKIGALGRMGYAGQFSEFQDRPDLVGGDQASAQLSGMAVRVDYDLIGDDGTIDLLVDADTGASGTRRGSLVSGTRAPAGAKQQVFIPLPKWVVVPREHNHWRLVARLNPKGDPPIETPRLDASAMNHHFYILSIRVLGGFSPAEDRELGDPVQKQSFHFPLEIWTAHYRAFGALKLKAYLAYSAYQTRPNDTGINDAVDPGDPGVAVQFTADFDAKVPDDAGQVKLWFEIEGLPPELNGGVTERLRSRFLTYDCKRKAVAVGGAGAVSAPWAQIDFQPLTVPNPRSVKPQVKPTTLGSIYDQVSAATGPGIKSANPPRMAVADPARDFLGINKVWSFDDVIPADGSFVNDVTFHYKAADLPEDPEFKEGKLQVVSWDPAGATLRWYATTVDTAAGTATARLDGLAPYYSLAMQGPLTGTTLNLPLTGDGFQTAVSLINTGTADVPVSATAFTPSGKPFDAGVNPYSGTLPKGRAMTGTTDMIFKAGLGGDGWVQARSATKSLAGGVLLAVGNEMESVGASPPVASMLVFTNVEHSDRSTTDLHLVNPGSFPAVAKLELRSAAGAVVDTAQLTLEPKGKRRFGLPSLFTAMPAPFNGYVLVKADHELAGAALITSGSALAALAAQPLSTASKLYAAHVEAGKGALATRVNLVNPGTQAVVGTIRFIGPDGTGPFPSTTLRLDPGAQMQRDLSQLFDFQGQVAAGSLIVEAAPGVVGDVGFSDDAGKARCLLPLGPPATAQSFVQLAAAQGAFTGLSVFNPGSTAAPVLVKTYSLDGSLTGAARIQLGASGRHSDLLSKTVSGAAGQLGGYFTVQSDQPIIAGAVFGSGNLAALAALDPQPAASDWPGTAFAVQPVSNTLTGLAAKKPGMSISSNSLDFGSVQVNTTKDLTLAVSNTGTADLSVSSLSVSNSRFSVVSPSAPFTVAAGAQRTVTIRFAPAAAGAQAGTLTISSNSAGQATLTVALAGTGSAAPPPQTPAIDVSPASLDFGSVSVGQSKSLDLTIRNTGNATLSVSSMTSSGAQFSVVGSVSLTVGTGMQSSVTVRFSPAAVGAQTATLTVRSNATAQPSLTVPLLGVGAAGAGPRNEELMVDDGTFERMAGYPDWNGDAFWVNRLTPPQYPAQLTRIRIYFPAEGDIAPNTQISLVLGTHPSGTEDVIAPRMRPAYGRVLQVGRWVDFDVTPETIDSGDFIVGFYTSVNGGLKPMALDVTRSAGRSYVSKDGTTYQMAESAGLGGNFLIRAVVRVGQ